MDKILSALNHLDCSELDHADWIRVGMALKNEGYDVNIWDEWSSKDAARYHPGECAKRWRSFREAFRSPPGPSSGGKEKGAFREESHAHRGRCADSRTARDIAQTPFGSTKK